MEKGSRINHALDKWVGIPIVFCLGLFKTKQKTTPASVGKIAILNLGSIGDNVFMSGPIGDLRSRYPNAVISVFTGATNYEIVRLIPGIDSITQLPIARPVQALKLIRDSGLWDVLFDFGPWPRLNAIYSFFFKTKCKVGFKTPNQFRHYVYDIKVLHSSEIHEIENHRYLIHEFYGGVHHAPQLKVIGDAEIESFIQNLGNYCIVHPWPGGYKSYMKQWANDKWVQLIRHLQNDYDHFILTGAPTDTEKSGDLYRLIKQATLENRVINIAGRFSLSQTVFLIQHASEIISIDTGIAHIAAALNLRQVCIQGPANSKRWAPYSSNSIVINPSKGTFGYLSYGFEYGNARENCMENISVEDVFQAVLTLWKKRTT